MLSSCFKDSQPCTKIVPAIGLDAVVFYRVFTFAARPNSCKINIAIPLDNGIYGFSDRQEDVKISFFINEDKDLVSSEQSSNHENFIVLHGSIILFDDEIAYFEPNFSPLEAIDGLCPQLKKEPGQVKHVKLQIEKIEVEPFVRVVAVNFSHSEGGEPLYFK